MRRHMYHVGANGRNDRPDVAPKSPPIQRDRIEGSKMPSYRSVRMPSGELHRQASRFAMQDGQVDVRTCGRDRFELARIGRPAKDAVRDE